MSEEKKILGFDRLNRPVYPGDIVTDALGERWKMNEEGVAYGA